MEHTYLLRELSDSKRLCDLQVWHEQLLGAADELVALRARVEVLEAGLRGVLDRTSLSPHRPLFVRDIHKVALRALEEDGAGDE